MFSPSKMPNSVAQVQPKRVRTQLIEPLIVKTSMQNRALRSFENDLISDLRLAAYSGLRR
jgi:hypothetical protein